MVRQVKKRTLRIETPRVFAPLLQPARYKGAFGGRGSGKSHAFAELLIERSMLRPGLRAVCVREVQRSLEQSVKRLLDDKLEAFQLGATFRSAKTQIETPGGGLVIFQGMQDHTADSIKSLEGYDVAWVEEAQSLSQRSLDLLRPTIRKPESEIWFSWNPRNDTDPVDAFFRKAKPPDAALVRSSYRDNPWFPDVLRREMEWDRAHDADKYAYVWLGEYEQHSEARVFKNWRVEEFETPQGVVFYFGADWGFAVDPTVLIRCWLSGRRLYVDAEQYAVGCEIDSTPMLFDRLGEGMARGWRITADSARPETISYMQRHGYPHIEPARKGPGSVEEGVTFLQSYEVIVHPRCQHTIDELTCYRYKSDPLTGRVLPILSDKKNHVIDALRYAVESLRHFVGIASAAAPPPTKAAADYGAQRADYTGAGRGRLFGGR
jgi:phage terminase large subunit